MAARHARTARRRTSVRSHLRPPARRLGSPFPPCAAMATAQPRIPPRGALGRLLLSLAVSGSLGGSRATAGLDSLWSRGESGTGAKRTENRRPRLGSVLPDRTSQIGARTRESRKRALEGRLRLSFVFGTSRPTV